ncbi:hypothetical protein IWQ56_006078 [Coemansia nantahalensis]|nr:hypothetical protein IWQ56_006078 [Coemansia nantahalensis]
MMSGSTVTFVLLSTCMGIQLLLTVITRNGRLATVVQPWYELGSFVAGFLITHPYMYLFRSVRWIPAAQVFFLEDVISVSRRNLWLIQWMWVFASIVFLFGIAVFTHLKISPVWTKEVNLAPASPEKLDLLDSPTVQNMTATHRRYIRSVTQRVMVYPMIPVFTQSMVVVANLLPRPPFWIFVMANIMPTFQGVLNFIAFALTPALDEYRKPLVKRLLGITRRRDAEFGELADAETLQPPSTVTSLPPSTFSAYKPGSAFIP